jgi:hypothetical protein
VTTIIAPTRDARRTERERENESWGDRRIAQRRIMKGASLCGGLLALAVIICPGARLRAQEPTRVRVQWEGLRSDEALQALQRAAGPRVLLLASSEAASDRRGTLTESTLDLRAALKRYADDFRRHYFRSGETWLLRHREWYLPEPAPASAGRHGRLPGSLAFTSSDPRKGTWELRALRASLSDIFRAITKTPGAAPHQVVVNLRQRKVSAGLSAFTLPAMRENLADLYPDAEWVRRGSAWQLQEKPNAQFVREVAAAWAGRDDEWSDAAGALYTQAAGELSPDQMRELAQSGSVRISWGALSPTSQALLRAKRDRDYAIDDASGVPRSLQADPTQLAQWGIEFVRRPGGGTQGRTLGRSPDGALTIGP